MKTSILVFGLVICLLMVNSEVVITNTGVIDHEIPITVSLSEPTTEGMGVKVSVSITVDAFIQNNEFPLGCFANTYSNVIPEGEVLQGFLLGYVGDGTATSTSLSSLIGGFFTASITMGDDDNFDLISNLEDGDSILDFFPDATWTDGVLSHSYEINQTYSDTANLNASISAAICIMGNDLTVNISVDEWGYAADEDVNLNPSATMVYWTAPAVEEESPTQDVGGKSSSAIETVVKVGSLALGILAWIL